MTRDLVYKRVWVIILTIVITFAVMPLMTSHVYADGQISGVNIINDKLYWDDYNGAVKYGISVNGMSVNGEISNCLIGVFTSWPVDLQAKLDDIVSVPEGTYDFTIDAFDKNGPILESSVYYDCNYKYTPSEDITIYPTPVVKVGNDFVVRWENKASDATPYVAIQEYNGSDWKDVLYTDSESSDEEELSNSYDNATDKWLEKGTVSHYIGMYLEPGKTYRAMVAFMGADSSKVKNSAFGYSNEFKGPSSKSTNTKVKNAAIDGNGIVTWDKADLPGVKPTYMVRAFDDNSYKQFESDSNTGFDVSKEMAAAGMADGEYNIVVIPYLASEKMELEDLASEYVTYQFKNPDKGTVVTKKSISNAAVSVKDLTYNAKERKPSVVVTLNGETLKKNKDYTVTYKNNINVGKATVTVKGIDSYKGSVKQTFNINPKSTTIKTLTPAKKALIIKWNRQALKMSAKRITGYEIWISTSKKFTADTTKKLTLKGYTKVSRRVNGLASNKKYYVKIRTYRTISGVDYYSAWSKVSSKKTK